MSSHNILDRLKNNRQHKKDKTTNNNNNNKDNKALKKFGIISAIIFSVIILLSLLNIVGSCNNNNNFGNCSIAYVQSSQAIILSAGLIGLGYCLITLKTFDVKVDQDLQNNYNDIIKELDDKKTSK